MDIGPELMVLLISIVYLITTIVMWRKKFVRHLLLIIIIIVFLKLTNNYFDNTFIVKYRPIFKLDSNLKKFNYEKDFINNINNLTNDQINNIKQETLNSFNYPVIKSSLFGTDSEHGPLVVKYPSFFMSEEQKIFHIINQFIYERIPNVKFKSIHFSFKTSIGHFLYVSIEIPHSDISNNFFKIKNKFLQMFISLDDKYIIWNNWINEPRD